MGMLDDARRKVKDWTTSDENIQGSPKAKIRDLSDALAQLTPQERQRNIEHVKAYLDYYYVAHQGEKKIPVEVHKEFSKMVEQSNRLTAVENARIVLQQYGGPPTRDTIESSLERSANQRAKEFSQYRIEPMTSREMSWRDLQPQQDRKQEQAQAQIQERTQTRTAEISHTLAPVSSSPTRIEAAPSLSQQTVAEPARQPATREAAQQPIQQVAAEPVRASVESAKWTQQTITEPTKSPQEMSKGELRAMVDQLDQKGNELRAQSKTVPVAELPAIRETIKSVQAELGKYDAELADRITKEIRQNRHGNLQESSRRETTAEPLKSVSQQAVLESAKQPGQQVAAEPVKVAVERAKSTQQTIAEPTRSSKEMSQDELRAKVKESIDQRLSGSESRQQRPGPAQEPSWKDLHPKPEQAQTQKQAKSQEHKHEQKQSRSRGKCMEISV